MILKYGPEGLRTSQKYYTAIIEKWVKYFSGFQMFYWEV